MGKTTTTTDAGDPSTPATNDSTAADQAALLNEAAPDVDAASGAAPNTSGEAQPVERAIALCLIDIPRLNAKAGQLVDAPGADVRAFAQDGQLDAHPGAVQYARDNGAEVVLVG